MQSHKLTPKQLAETLGWTPGDLGAILGGHKTVGKKRLQHIHDTLGISFEFKIGSQPLGITPSPMVAEEEMPWSTLASQALTRPEGPEELASVNVFPLQLAMSSGDKRLQVLVETMILPARLTRLAPLGLKVETNEMAPTIPNGSVVGLDYKSKEIEEGSLYVVRVPGKGAVIRRVFTGPNETIILSAENKVFPDIVLSRAEAEKGGLIVGRVGWVMQAF